MTDPKSIPSQLPPIGQSITDPEASANAVQIVYQRRAAIQAAFKRPLALAATCRKVATWGEDTDWPDECRTIVHRIRQGIETQVANHLKEPAQSTIDPTQTGEYAKWYWCAPPEVAEEISGNFPLDPVYLGGVDPMTGEPIRPLPLPLKMVLAYRQLSQAQPDVFDPQYITKNNEEFRCKTIQRVFDSDWRDGGVDEWLRSRVYACAQEGWELPLFEYDHDLHLPILGFNTIDATYIDQTAERITIGKVPVAVEGGVDVFLDEDEALGKYPQYEAEIREAATDTLASPGNGGTLPVPYRGTMGGRRVPMIVWWLCNRRLAVPMTEQEALHGGHVIDVAGQRDDGLPEQSAIQNMPVADFPDGQQGNGPPSGDAGEDAGEQPAGTIDGNLGQDQTQMVPAEQSGPAYVIPGSQQPVDPSHPLWPHKLMRAVNRLCIIGDTLVEDVVEPLGEIPLLHLRNTLVPGRPWGIGEPFYGQKLQDTITDITQAGADHIQYNAHPATWMPDGLKNHLESVMGDAHVLAGTVLGLPPPYDTMENPVKLIEPPPFPASNLQILQFITDEFNRVTYQSDVQQGESPTATASGELAATLLSAANEPLAFKAQEITYMIEKLSRLMLHCIINYKPIDLIAQISGVPVPLAALVIDGLKTRFPSVSATVATGAGAVNARKRAQLVQWNQMISPDDKTPLVSGKTVREFLPVDGPTEERRVQEAIRNAATVLAPLQGQAATAAQPAEPQNGESGSNGNGRFH